VTSPTVLIPVAREPEMLKPEPTLGRIFQAIPFNYNFYTFDDNPNVCVEFETPLGCTGYVFTPEELEKFCRMGLELLGKEGPKKLVIARETPQSFGITPR
jgi:hypothetical protein